ncbi:MAG: PDZ domain-containing protein [Deltaproteobacteria bacterium]|nr:PDZ domain-containing protein [Deltaproteobacteria bacterium]
MKAPLLKLISPGGAIVFFVVIICLALVALFFTDDREEVLGDVRLRGPRATQPMELRGNWLGIKLASLNSPTARRFGIPTNAHGVMVVEISERAGLRARQAGVLSGDVITAVDKNNVRDIADLYEVSRKLDVAAAILLDVQRWGQDMTLVLPAAYAMMPPATTPPSAAAAPPAQMAAPGPRPGAPQPAAWMPGRAGGQFYCPTDKLIYSQAAVQPRYRCLRCNSPLVGVR